MTTFADRPGYQRVSSTLWKQREDYCASLIQKAWNRHKSRNTESHTENPMTGDEDDDNSQMGSSSAAAPLKGGILKKSKSKDKVGGSKHLIEVRSADSSTAGDTAADKPKK